MPTSRQREHDTPYNAARSEGRSTGTYAAPQLQHRHFAFIAACIAGMSKVARLEACEQFIARLYRTNAAFDSARFRTACNCEISEYTLNDLDQDIATIAFWLDALREERVRRMESEAA